MRRSHLPKPLIAMELECEPFGATAKRQQKCEHFGMVQHSQNNRRIPCICWFLAPHGAGMRIMGWFW